MSKTWKAVERAVAQYLDGERVSCEGLGEKMPDVETEGFSIEVKSRQHYPKWLEDAMQQSEDNARDGRWPIVFLHRKFRNYPEDMVIMRASAFQHFTEVLSDVLQHWAF